ncbi:tyrosine-protein phosphatase [Jongsikchunia kroppenstedtii]|uniref:tyrosine-protein phosphatase n=1 Tax=Jongsikchunia kroppenstedtii TaxID=1121721 RepID=UPI00037DA3A7|nr:tyrosine-protein phosphatase [Jongsikchunia kroppenstedtii]
MKKQLVSALATAALVAVPATSMVATAQAAPPPATTAPATTGLPHSLGLTSVKNARDLGGYRTANDKTLASGLVFRTANLATLSPADAAKLTSLHLATDVDLRTAIERTVQPDRPVAGAAQQWNDVLGQANPIDMLVLSGAYVDFVTNPAARAAFSKTLKTIETNAAAGKATLFHCSAGKDRTGWTAAVLLTILGVDRSTVNQDYLLSNAYNNATPNDPINGVNIDWLNASFNAAKQHYGSFDNYVRNGLGLTAADIASLKHSLLK